MAMLFRDHEAARGELGTCWFQLWVELVVGLVHCHGDQNHLRGEPYRHAITETNKILETITPEVWKTKPILYIDRTHFDILFLRPDLVVCDIRGVIEIF